MEKFHVGIIGGNSKLDAPARGESIKDKPSFRKYEVVDTEYVDQEMNKKISMSATNSHLHFSELSTNHPSFHEIHDPTPQFMDQDLERFHQSDVPQTDTASHSDSHASFTYTESPHTTGIPPTPTFTTLTTISTRTRTTPTTTTTTTPVSRETITMSTSTTTFKSNTPQLYFSKFHNGGNYAVQRPGNPLSLPTSKYSDVLHTGNIDASTNNQKVIKANSPSKIDSSTRDPNIDTSEKIIESEKLNDSQGVVAYLVSDPHTPGEEFFITKEALMKSGVINNKIVSLTSYNGIGGGQVEILSEKVFNITGVWYRGTGRANDITVVVNDDLLSGSADWLVGARFPIGKYSDSVTMAPLQEDQVLVLPDQVLLRNYTTIVLILLHF